MRKLLGIALVSFLSVQASEAPHQLQTLGQKNKSTQTTPIFDECSNEECYGYCKAVQNTISDPIVVFSVGGELLSSAGSSLPSGCGALAGASCYLTALMCCTPDKVFEEDYSFKLARLARTTVKEQILANIFPCVAEQLAKEKKAQLKNKSE